MADMNQESDQPLITEETVAFQEAVGAHYLALTAENRLLINQFLNPN